MPGWPNAPWKSAGLLGSGLTYQINVGLLSSALAPHAARVAAATAAPIATAMARRPRPRIRVMVSPPSDGRAAQRAARRDSRHLTTPLSDAPRVRPICGSSATGAAILTFAYVSSFVRWEA